MPEMDVYTVKPVKSDIGRELLCRNRQGVGLYSANNIVNGQMGMKIKVG